MQVALLPGVHTPRTSRVLSHELPGLGDRREPSVPSSWGGTIWGTGVNPDWPSSCWVSRCCSFVVLFLGFVKGPQGPPVCTQQTSRAKGPRGLLESHPVQAHDSVACFQLVWARGPLLACREALLFEALSWRATLGSLPFPSLRPLCDSVGRGKGFYSQASGSKGSQASVGSEACLMHHAL